MAQLVEFWRNGEGADLIIGRAADAERAGRMGYSTDRGIHRYVHIIGRFAYKVPCGPWCATANIEEYAAMMMLRRCACALRNAATPTSLWRLADGRIIAAQPAYRIHGYDADRIARNEFMHRIIHHNGEDHHPHIIDMHDNNFMVDDMGNIRIIDLGFGDEAGWSNGRSHCWYCAGSFA